ncbi:hypothetical protein HG537_0B03270 [Torulaspora globosa]|uniref:CS domain-containing protein n=1 Tax=Torulaspora globosa TaxID=48254 RepID=A0A7H9HNU7_9SACH|nr:hypothetical protein HG537_0B03270 [Torulaspora sp. CBS 2947]
MLTPEFVVSQDDKFVFIKVKVSTVRFSASGLEMAVDGTVFVFYLSPYYLRLTFPDEIVDDERATAKYCSKEECIDIQLPKLREGTFFEDLDVPTKLLARRGDLVGAHALSKRDQGLKKPLIEEIGFGNENLEKDDLQAISAAGDSFNWEIEQNVKGQCDGLLSMKYGFEDLYDTSVSVSVSNGNDINELDDPERTAPNDRVRERLGKEDLKFDPEYYVSEYMIKRYATAEDLIINGIEEVMKFTPAVVKDYLKWYKNTDDRSCVMPVVFTEKEQEQMQKYIPRKEYLVSDPKRLYVTVLCLLFAYIFEEMETGGVHNTESAWSIGKLTPQICFLDQQLVLEDTTGGPSLIRAAIITGIRRSLSYPLHRNYDLSTKAWTFVYYVLRGGKRLVTRCLLDIHEIFRFHDVYYVYNRILLDDLCSWFISQGSENVTRSLALELKKELDQISKDEIEFNCISGVNDDTGELTTENMTIREMEILAEKQFQESEATS